MVGASGGRVSSGDLGGVAARMLLHAPAARPAAEDVGMVEEAIEERADGGIDRRTHDALAQRVAEEAPAPDAHVVRDELSAPAFVVVKCRSGGRLARPP